jgi:hypothetical protein
MKKLLVAFLLFLSACSMHTLHSYRKEACPELSRVDLNIVHGKDKYLIRKAFQNEFYVNGDDVYKDKRYELSLKVSDAAGDWLIQQDSSVLRKNITIVIDYSLKNLKTDTVVDSGSTKALIVYPESPSAWSSQVSSERAYENALNDAMRFVRIKVSLFLSKKNPTGKDENKSKKP